MLVDLLELILEPTESAQCIARSNGQAILQALLQFGAQAPKIDALYYGTLRWRWLIRRRWWRRWRRWRRSLADSASDSGSAPAALACANPASHA